MEEPGYRALRISNLETEVAGRDRTIAELHKALAEEKKRNSGLEKFAQSAQSSLEAAKADLTALERRHLDALNNLADAQKEIRMSTQTIDDLNRTIAEKDNALQALRREHEKMQRSAQEMVNNIESKRRQAYEELLKVKAELDNTVSSLTESRTALGAAREQFATLEDRFAQLRATAERKISNLDREREQIRTERDHARNELAIASQELASLRNKAGSSLQDIDRLTRDQAGALKELNATRSELDSTKARLAETQNELQVLTADFKQLMHKSNQTISALNSKYEDAERALNDTRSGMNSTRTELDETQTTLKTTSEEFERTRQELNEVRAALEERQKELMNLNEQHRSTVSELDSTKKTLQRTTYALDRTAANLNDTSSNLSEVRSAFDAKQIESANLTSEQRRLAKELDNAQNALKQKSTEAETATTELNKLKTNLIEMRKGYSALDKDHRKALADLKSAQASLEQALADRASEHDQVQANLSDDLEKTRIGLNQKTAELAAISDQLTAVRAEHRTLEENHRLLQEELEKQRLAAARADEELLRSQQEKAPEEGRHEATIKKLQAELVAAKNTLSGTRAKYVALEAEKRQALASLAEAHAENDLKEAALAEARELLARSGRDADRELGRDPAFMRKTAIRPEAPRDEEFTQTLVDLEIARTELRRAESERDRMNGLMTALSEEISDLRRSTPEFADTRNSSAIGELVAARNEVRKLSAALMDMRTEIEDAHRQIASGGRRGKGGHADSDDDVLAKLRMERDRAQAALSDARRTIDDLTYEVDILQRTSGYDHRRPSPGYGDHDTGRSLMQMRKSYLEERMVGEELAKTLAYERERAMELEMRLRAAEDERRKHSAASLHNASLLQDLQRERDALQHRAEEHRRRAERIERDLIEAQERLATQDARTQRHASRSAGSQARHEEELEALREERDRLVSILRAAQSPNAARPETGERDDLEAIRARIEEIGEAILGQSRDQTSQTVRPLRPGGVKHTPTGRS